MSNNGQTGRPSGAPQQQLSPPTDPRKRNIPSATGSPTTQQRARASVPRQGDKYNTAMPITSTSPSGPEHPPVYGYVPRAMPVPQPAPPSANVIALRDVLLMPPPPPPPPPQATTVTAPPIYTAPPSTAPTYTCGHQIPKEFDPTQPPPIMRPQPNASRKRGATDNMQAGPSSKIRQMELPDGPCTDCVQRNIRTSIYQEQSTKLEQELKLEEAGFSNRTEHLENGKLWLKSILNPRQYSLMENFVENGWTNSLFSEPSPSSSFASFFQETPVSPRQSLLDQLLEALLGGSRKLNNSMPHIQPSTSREDSLLQMLSGGSRRSSAAESSLGVLLEAISTGSSSAEAATTSTSPDRLHAVIEALRPTVESEQRAPSERAGSSSNGLSRLANGIPSAPLAVPAPAPYAIRPVQATAPPPAARPYYTQPYPPPVPAPAPGPAPQPTPLQPYYAQQHSQPAAAARPFYAPRYVPGAPQPPAPPPQAQQFASPYYANPRPPLPDPRAQPPTNQYPHFGPPYPPYYPHGPSGPAGPPY